jgi:heme/copper-type cytochrome/quinol oxidase subunit 1
MFTQVRYFIKTSIIFLVIGLLSGLFISVAKNMFNIGFSQELVSAHAHIILVGSIFMMIMGVSLWFFPKASKDDTRYNPELITLTYWIITIATVVRFISQIIIAYIEIKEIRWAITVSSSFQMFAMVLFFYSMWGRIRSVGSHLREEKGEKF